MARGTYSVLMTSQYCMCLCSVDEAVSGGADGGGRAERRVDAQCEQGEP